MTQYGTDPRQRLWVRPGSRAGGRWLVVIHGGAWRDPNYSEETGKFCAENLSSLFDGVSSVTYRLAPEHKHPAQAQDVASALKFLHDEYKFEQLVLAGHSAGAFIAGQIAAWNWSPVPVSLVIGIEGIYKLKELIDEYPDYRDMIADCFTYDEEIWLRATPNWEKVRLLAIHSVKDELLTLRQPSLVSSRVVQIPSGAHDEVFESINLEPFAEPAIRRAFSN